MFKKVLITLFLFSALTVNSDLAYTANDEESYTTLSVVDLNTFNEYRYRITDKYLDLRNKFEVEWKIDAYTANKILTYAKEGLNYLPDSLSNKNYYNYLKSSIEKGIKYPENSSNFESIAKSIENYLNKTTIKKVSGTVESYPSTGNAPLTVTLRWNVKDPTWTKLENYNYTWWINEWWKRRVIWNKISLTYIFKEEWNYSVFLDVTSNHKNSLGFTDVLPFSSRANIIVKEKIASVILKVNSDSLRQKDELKFTPDEARYWLLFDATSSTPTSGTKFTKTEWDFGNWVTKTYSWSPKMERVSYAKEWEFNVSLKLRTNEGKTVTREFTLRIHNPIATISASNDEWYLWDKFTFTANPTWNDDDLTYSWRIIDTTNDIEVLSKTASTFTYSFRNKGKYNVKLFVTEPSWETDTDNKIIYINSRAPEADFNYSIPYPNKPNTVFLDATKSYDPDFSDEWKLDYSWVINGQRIELEKPNFNGSNGFFTFSSIGDHSVVLEVTDPDDITSQKKDKVTVKSVLSVEFYAFPRVVQREKMVRFVSDSPKAKFFEWDFGDGIVEWWKEENINHVFKKSWVYNVKLKVIDENDNENNFDKSVYIWDTDSPYAFITLVDNKSNNVSYKDWVCNGEWAYILNRVDNFTFSWNESIDVTWESTWLSYSWKIWNALYSTNSFSKKFDEIWCEKVKLVVKSDKNWKESVKTINIKVENILPTLSSLDVRVQNAETDPVVVSVTALGAKDKDGVIQSYLWYYYTDIDPEPQDFRATKSNSTSFVIPKVTWNYYFVVVMKDNNEARSNSETINGSKYFITLTGDNVNTPLVGLSVDDNSVSIWEEVTFTSNVENILGHSLNKKVKYSWDFDWDWFYDTETTSNIVSHKYKTSGEKHAKVKVKYKGFSNTKSLTVNVSNILKPDFDYVSIWKDFIFFDNSLGQNANYEWDFWDGVKVLTKGSVNHTYDDGKNIHLVKLKLTEWTKVKEITKKVVRDYSNIIATKKDGLIVFSNFDIEENTITVKDDLKNLYVYLWANNWEIANYVIDSNIESDSDLNGWDDDDEDNKNENNYFSWESILVELDRYREQTIRLYTKDINGEVIEARDIKIVKEYIEEEEIDINSIVFDWVSNSVKVKLEKLKQAVWNFPKEHKLKWLMYVQKLKEEWNDDREKTNIILEFEWFIDEIAIPGWTELIDLLESLLIEWENDKGEKAIAYTALKNLIPKNIKCIDWTELNIGEEKVTCYDLLVAKLDVIWENSNIDENKELGKQILENIATDTTMTVKEKTDFKAILNTFVYGSVSNIPVEEKEVVIEEKNDNDSKNKVIDTILSFLWIVFIIILLFIGAIWLFFLYYKIVNNDKSKSFSDFITEKTSWKKVRKDDTKEFDDILGMDSEISLDKEDEKDILNWDTNEDILSKPLIEDTFEKKEETKVDEIKEEKEEKIEEEKLEEEKPLDKKDWEIPAWLKWNFSEDPVDDWIKEEAKKEEPKEEEIKKEEVKTPVKENKKEEEKVIADKGNDSWIPDWLKWSFEEPKKDNSIKEESKKEIKKPIEEVKSKEESVKKEETNIEEDKKDWDIPDWLKWSFDVPSKEEKVEAKEVKQTKQTKQTSKKETITKPLDKKETAPADKKTETKEEPKLETKEELDEFTKLEEAPTKDDDNIPDWLKWSFDEKPKAEEKPKTEKKTETKKVETKAKKVAETKKTEEVKKVEEVKTETKKTSAVKKTPAKANTSKVVKDDKKEEIVKPKAVAKKGTTKKDEAKKDESSVPEETELWDDGMKVPDWLKTEDDK